MKRAVTFSGQMPNDEEGDDGSTVDSASQAARIIASLEAKKLATDIAHTVGAAGFAELLAQLLLDYVYVSGRPGGAWWHANGAGVWKEADDAPQGLVADASKALEAYIRGKLTDRLDRIDSLLAPKLTKELGIVVRRRLLQVVKDHLALRRRLENDLVFQGEVLSKLQQLLADADFHSHHGQVNHFARKDAVFLVDAARCRLEPIRERRAILELKLVLAGPSMEPTEPAEAWIAPNWERWAVAMQILGFALISGARPRLHRVQEDVELPRIIQIVGNRDSSFGASLATAFGSYAAVVDVGRRSPPPRKQLLGKRLILIHGTNGEESLCSPSLIRGILKATSGNKAWPVIVVSSTDRTPLAVKGQTVVYLDLREISAGPTVRQLQSLLLRGFRSLGEPGPEFETRPTPRLEFTVQEAVQEVVQAVVEASGVESCRPLTVGSCGGAMVERERVSALVERLEERAKELGFLSLTIRHNVVVSCLKAMGFSTSNSTNRRFWWFRNAANETPGDGDGGDTRDRGLTTVQLAFSVCGNQGKGLDIV